VTIFQIIRERMDVARSCLKIYSNPIHERTGKNSLEDIRTQVRAQNQRKMIKTIRLIYNRVK